ncbi:hypothetical protein SAMN05518845_12012 [Variovorax sp. YR750]|uniref:hypothetical protein n=1 Tax=Variovorax sp. YR750 TaxID=1884384 RepID=UPI0008BFA01B|nr:hypothetical protein [Variovorax sp. YR750]SEM30299.1 hypothetical protein SAMN05518845_12012 [Variovorax sp. YR750]
MAYAAYREHPGVPRTHVPMNTGSSPFYVLDVTVCCADALRVRRSIAGCPEAGVVRCEPLLHACSSQESDAPCVRLMIRLPLGRYADVLHRLIECVPSGEIGRLVSWREHLARCGLRHGH